MMTLKKVIDLFDEKVDAKTKTMLASMGSVDSPPLGIDEFETVFEKIKKQGQKSGICRARIGDLYTDATYNRSNNINYTNVSRHMKKIGGFSNRAAGVISAFVRPDGKLVVTKGNHRVTMKYASCLDPNEQITVEITLHDADSSYSDIIRKEAEDHNVDCNYRTSQNTDDRFRAAFHAGESWAVNLHWYVQPFSISIAGTNPNGKFGTTSYAKIAEARNLDESSCSRYLKAFTDVVTTEKEVMGFATFSATSFLYNFRESIKYVDDANNMDSITGFFDYIYNKRYELSGKFGKNVTQQKLSEGSNKIKGHEIGVARLVSLYNEYCEKILEAKIPVSNKNAIGYSSKEYQRFLEKTNVDLRLRVDEISHNLF